MLVLDMMLQISMSFSSYVYFTLLTWNFTQATINHFVLSIDLQLWQISTLQLVQALIKECYLKLFSNLLWWFWSPLLISIKWMIFILVRFLVARKSIPMWHETNIKPSLEPFKSIVVQTKITYVVLGGRLGGLAILVAFQK